MKLRQGLLLWPLVGPTLHNRPARIDLIDRSNLGSIDFGVVGPKRETAPRPSLMNLFKLLPQGCALELRAAQQMLYAVRAAEM